MKPLSFNKIVSNENITLVEGKEITKIDQTNAKVLNNFFSNIIKNLEISLHNQVEPICQNIKDPLIKAIIKKKNQPIIIAIKERYTNSKFSCSFTEKNDVLKEIKYLQINEATQDSGISTKLVKNNSDLFLDFIFTNLNDSIAQPTFSSLLKRANINSVHKKTRKHRKDHFRPVSILSNISNIYERIMFKQICRYFELFFSKFQYGFRKGFTVQ